MIHDLILMLKRLALETDFFHPIGRIVAAWVRGS